MSHMVDRKHSECRDTGQLSAFSLDGETSFLHACKKAEQYLMSYGIEDAAVDAWYLLEYATGISRTAYLADRGQNMSKKQRDAYAALVNRRGAHIPLQRLTGKQEFMGLSFRVNENVLIPRWDTETLVQLALQKLEAYAAAMKNGIGGDLSETVPEKEETSGRQGGQELRVLDLCTGSGCIAVSLAKHWEQLPGQAAGLRITASDISEEAVAAARENAERLQADVRVIRSDMFSEFESDGPESSRFHMIVSNPPYIRTAVIEELSEEVRSHEPRIALDGGEDGLDFYRKIIRESCGYLMPGGWLLLEIGFDQGNAVTQLMRQNGFSEVAVAKDLPGHDRVVSGRVRYV
ncbi:MAG: peptide chain release factor N(5)-glutamine methyltransferase [Clostridiales bacterium]|nr:peptide chain release factor N(5)-glutamine methyltransferase [Clostridiales bacterium]